MDASKGRFRVSFEEDNIISAWLPVLVPNSKGNKDELWFDKDEQVACLMDEHCENGVILGTFYSSGVLPAIGNKDIRATTFEEGSYVKFDRSTSTMTIHSKGDVIIKQCANVTIEAVTLIKLDSDVQVTGKLTVKNDIESTTGNVKAIAGDVKATLISLISHTHAVSGSSTGPALP